MDGEAIATALGSCPGPDCFKDVVPNSLGARLRVYGALKNLCEQSQVLLVYFIMENMCISFPHLVLCTEEEFGYLQ